MTVLRMSLEQVKRQVELANRQDVPTPRVDALTDRLHKGKTAAQIVGEDWSVKYRDLALQLERELVLTQVERDNAAEILIQLGRESAVAITGEVEDSADILTPHQANAAIREEIRLGREAANEANEANAILTEAENALMRHDDERSLAALQRVRSVLYPPLNQRTV